MADYVGILEGADDVWSIRIPDLPGCHGGGASPEQAIADASSAAKEWIADVRGDGFPIRIPRGREEIVADRDAEFNPAAGESLVMIQIELERSSTTSGSDAGA